MNVKEPNIPQEESAPVISSWPKEGASQTSAEAPQKHAVKKKKVKEKPQRRVGTVTFGIVLVIIGLTLIWALFNPNWDLTFVLKLSPLVLVCLGIEILCAYFYHKGEGMRYDFFSGFMCFFLVFLCLGAATAWPFYGIYGPARYHDAKIIQQQVEDLCYDALKDNGNIAQMAVQVSLEEALPEGEEGYTSLDAADHVGLSFILQGRYETKEGFAQAVRQVLDGMASLDLPLEYIRFVGNGEKQDFSLYISDKFQRNMTAENLGQQVEVNERIEPEDQQYTDLQGYEENTAEYDSEESME